VDVMSMEDLAILDTDGNTALPYAISVGNYRMTACMIGKNNNLVSIKYSKSSNITMGIQSWLDISILSLHWNI
jgi:ankyrin repeat protein